MKFSASLALAALIAPVGSLAAQTPLYHGPPITHTEVAPGVHAFVFTNSGVANVDGTAVAIINDRDVVVVDAQWTPATARRVVAEIRKLTRKPVRFVITTHWHGDHWIGNQAYLEAFPGVDFIAHENTLVDLEEDRRDLIPTRDSTIPAMIADFRSRLQRGVRRDGGKYTTTDSANVRAQIAGLNWAKEALRGVYPVLPTITVADSMVIRRGARSIVIRYLGRGNTRGDLSIWLPQEQVLITGDLMVNPVPYTMGSYIGEWATTLGKLRSLPAKVIIPGHGPIQRDWNYLDLLTELFTSITTQTRDAVAKGLDLEATRKAVDLSAFRTRFLKGDETLGRAFDGYVVGPAVERAWLEARGEIDKPGAPHE